jgi:hypothetical protein
MTAMLEKTSLSHFLVLTCFVAGCGLNPSGVSGGAAGDTSGAGGGAGSGPVCAYGQIICDEGVAKVCDGAGHFTSTTSCPGQRCQDGLGCVACAPNTSQCAGNTLTICDSAGNASQVTCEGPGITGCDSSGCHGPCSPTSLQAANAGHMGNEGCDFWPTVTANPVWSDPAHQNQGAFHFGVLLGNVSSETANVTITIGGETVSSSVLPDGRLQLAPGEARKVPLDWVPELKGADWTQPFEPVAATQSVKKPSGAYHIVSSQPIIAYQFNPLEVVFGDASGTCPFLTESGVSENQGHGCYSYSTDASLLLPSHVLQGSYVVSGYRGWRTPIASTAVPSGGNFLTITATKPGSAVKITPRSGQMLLGLDNAHWSPGQPVTVNLGAGDVVQLFTTGLLDQDSFSGTKVEESSHYPLQLLTGAGCATVPVGIGNCSHMEDGVLPNTALGIEYVVPAIGHGANNMLYTLRIQAISDGTALSFEPAATYKNVILNAGEVLEIPGKGDARISGTMPFAVTQYVNGDSLSSPMGAPGDPSLNEGGPGQVALPPRDLYRADYAFLVPPISDFNSFVAIMAPTGAMVKIDGRLLRVDQFTAVGASGMSITRLPVNLQTANMMDRVHTVQADRPVGVVVYGYGAYTNYVYSAGQYLQ